MKITVTILTCHRCGHTWPPRKPDMTKAIKAIAIGTAALAVAVPVSIGTLVGIVALFDVIYRNGGF